MRVKLCEVRFEADRNLATEPFPAMQEHLVMGEFHCIHIKQQAALSIKIMASFRKFPAGSGYRGWLLTNSSCKRA